MVSELVAVKAEVVGMKPLVRSDAITVSTGITEKHPTIVALGPEQPEGPSRPTGSDVREFLRQGHFGGSITREQLQSFAGDPKNSSNAKLIGVAQYFLKNFETMRNLSPKGKGSIDQADADLFADLLDADGNIASAQKSAEFLNANFGAIDGNGDDKIGMRELWAFAQRNPHLRDNVQQVVGDFSMLNMASGKGPLSISREDLVALDRGKMLRSAYMREELDRQSFLPRKILGSILGGMALLAKRDPDAGSTDVGEAYRNGETIGRGIATLWNRKGVLNYYDTTAHPALNKLFAA